MLRGLEASKGFLGGPRRSQEVLGSHIFPLDSYLNLVRILVKSREHQVLRESQEILGIERERGAKFVCPGVSIGK